MRFKGRMPLEHGFKQIDIAPLVNLIFLVFIFILLVFGFMLEPGLKVNLPRVVNSGSVRADNIDIMINNKDIVYAGARPVKTQELELLFKSLIKRNPTVSIIASRRASVGKVAQICDLARGLGLTQVNILTNEVD